MSPQRPRRFHLNLALCLAVMTVVVALALAWLGLSPMTAVIVAIAVACPVTMLYAWWLSRRSLRRLNHVGLAGARRKS